MCGLLFQITKKKISREDAVKLLESLQLIKHRGPNGEGVLFIDSNTGRKWTLRTPETPAEIDCDGILDTFPENTFDICMGHRRLSIFDLSVAGHQPYMDDKGNALIFNGEIYNFKEIKEGLIKEGFTFHTKTDTEVILAAYQKWNTSAFEKFNGMFSFLLWDNNQKKVIAVNDRYGVKPLYYFENKEQKIFVSELKQFIPFQLTQQFNWEKIAEFLQFGLIDHDYDTLLANISRFPNAHYALLDWKEQISVKSYYKVDVESEAEQGSQRLDEFPALFENAVNIRLRADVPTGIGASGGLDSSLVLYTAQRLRKTVNSHSPIKTVSAISPGYKEDESEYIHFIEKDLKIDAHYVNPVETFNVQDFINHLWHLEAPVLSTSFYAQWKVAGLAKQNDITVLLVGQGADETFAGYHHHFYRYCSFLLQRLRLSKLSNEINDFAALKNMSKRKLWKIVIDELKLKYKIRAGITSFKNETYTKRIATASIKELLYIDFAHAMLPYYLRADDRSAMAFSIETRHPFLDYRIVDFAFQLSMDNKIKNGWQKFILREKFDYLPANLRYRKDKKGFTAPKDEILEQLMKIVNVPEELINYCKQKRISLDTKSIQVLSLSLWMNLIKEKKTVS